jgi:hypothetical protein
MHRKDAIAWVLTVCATSLRLSQAKTLAILVAATLRVQRVSLANIGRGALGRAKHQIKRCGRFVANERVEPADAMRGIIAKLTKKRTKPLLVALDWVGAVTQNIVVRWKSGLPSRRDECWFLMTDLDGAALQLCQLYGRRMTIEQLFRDHKSKRNGWSLRDTQIKSPDNLDRLLLILAIAYLLLCGIGLIAQKGCRPSAWSSSSKQHQSIFQIGLIMIDRILTRCNLAFSAVYHLTLEAAGNWG